MFEASRIDYSPAVQKASIVNFILRVFRPIVRIGLRYSLSVEEFHQIIRWLAVQELYEHEEFRNRRKQFTSRVACLTGLSRKEVKRLKDMPSPFYAVTASKDNRAVRVLRGWLEDPRAITKDNQPQTLPLTAEQGFSFTQLCKEYSGDVPSRTILDELILRGNVELINEEQVRLVSEAYVPSGSADELLNLTGICLGDFAATLEYNLRAEVSQENRLCQKQGYARHVPLEKVPVLRHKLAQSANEFILKMHRLVSSYDEPRPSPRKQYKSVGLGVYYVERNPG